MSHLTQKQGLLTILASVLIVITSTNLNNMLINIIISCLFNFLQQWYIPRAFSVPSSRLGNWRAYFVN